MANRESGLGSVLSGHPLTDSDIEFIHEALKRSGNEYTADGLNTFAEWELHGLVSLNPDGRWTIMVSGGRVNAEWTLYVDPTTGEVEQGAVFTEAPEPQP